MKHLGETGRALAEVPEHRLRLVQGTKHVKVLIDGRLATVLPTAGRWDRDKRRDLNAAQAIRRGMRVSA